MKVAIVIVAYNNLAYTQICLNSIFRHSFLPYKLFLVNNGSVDRTKEYFSNLKSEKPNEIEVITSKTNLGFAGGNNLGIKKALEDKEITHIMLLNNDTIVCDIWMLKMESCLNKSKADVVGPVSNYVGGSQMLWGVSIDPSNIDSLEAFEAKHYKNTQGKFDISGRIVGLCMLVKRGVFEEVGVFDEIFGLGMWEDNDLCLRITEAGYKIAIARDVFIYHFGSKTVKNVDAFKGKTLFEKNKQIFYDKWAKLTKRGEHKKLVGMLRVKNGEDFLEETLTKVSEMVDEIVVFDDHSTDKTEEICKKFSKIVIYEKSKQDTFNEARDRNHLLQLAKSRNPDWIWNFDCDEVPEDRLIKDIQELINPENPEIKLYCFKISHAWNDKDQIRVDGLWGDFWQGRLFKVNKNHCIIGDEDGLHCFTPETQIFLKDKDFIYFKNIKDVDKEDKVLTHTGEYKSVVDTYKRKYSGDMLNLHCYGAKLKVTPNHRFLTLRKNKCKYPHERTVCDLNSLAQKCEKCGENKNLKYELEWVEARDLNKYDYLTFPKVNSEEQDILNLEESYLYGFFLGDGCFQSEGRYITMALNILDEENREKVYDAAVTLGEPLLHFVPNYNVMRVSLHRKFLRKEFLNILEKSGKGKNKKISNKIFNLSWKNKCAFIKGMFESDGNLNIRKNGVRQWMHCTCNHNLTHGLSVLLSSMKIPHAYHTEEHITPYSKGKLSKSYKIALSDFSWELINGIENLDYKLNTKIEVFKDYIISPIYKIDKEHYEGDVYNLGVEKDNSYVADGVIAHNCGSHPHIPIENMKIVPYRIKHYGNLNPATRAQKYLWYTRTDKNKDVGCILGKWANWYKGLYWNLGQIKNENTKQEVIKTS